MNPAREENLDRAASLEHLGPPGREDWKACKGHLDSLAGREKEEPLDHKVLQAHQDPLDLQVQVVKEVNKDQEESKVLEVLLGPMAPLAVGESLVHLVTKVRLVPWAPLDQEVSQEI